MSPVRVVLPARLQSTRLPEKLLQVVAGKSVLQHTYEAASKSKAASSGIVVAVDDPRLAEIVESFGGQWIMTPKDCPSGTDRIACVADSLRDAEIFVNVQSDEPEIDPAAIDAVADLILADTEADIATAGTPIRTVKQLQDPGIVKIVVAANDSDGAEQSRAAGQGRAVYFSRAAIPYVRDADPLDADGELTQILDAEPTVHWHHLGLYAYRRDFLTWFVNTPPSQLEQTERLEQLRAIEAGKRIVVAHVGQAASGIDTPADLDAFRKRMESS